MRFSHRLLSASRTGCIQSYRCVTAAHAGDPFSCRRIAPSLSPFGAVFWVLQLLITIRAYVLLPESEKKGQRIVEHRAMLSPEARCALATGKAPPADIGVSQPGGVLVHMRVLDLILAGLVLIASTSAMLLCRSEVVGVTLFWIRTAHGLLSAPYVVLRLPGVNTLLTHARRTGYDRWGHTKAWRAAPRSAPGAATSANILPSMASDASPAFVPGARSSAREEVARSAQKQGATRISIPSTPRHRTVSRQQSGARASGQLL